jgi:hypothetical protein
LPAYIWQELKWLSPKMLRNYLDGSTLSSEINCKLNG